MTDSLGTHSFDNAPIAYQSLDLSGVILEVNSEWEQLSGYTASEMVGHNYLELVPEDHLADFRANLERLAADGELVGADCLLRRKDESIRSILIFGRIDASAERTNCMLVDITGFRGTERELVDSEERFRSLFALAPTPVLIHDGHSVVMANRACAKFLGYNHPDELVGTSLVALVFPEDRSLVAERVQRLMTEDWNAPAQEERFMRRDGTVACGEAIAAPVMLGGQRVVYVMAIDLAERKHSEAELEKYRLRLEELLAERTESLERVRHELGAVTAVVSRTVEMRDPYTAGHQRRVATLAVAVARQLEMSDLEIEQLEVAARLHDVGKVGVPAELLSKPALLTALEDELVRTHVEAGYEIVLSAQFGGDVAEIVRQHHERIDGSGYPQGLRDEDLLPASKVLMVADVVEAMSSHRPYRASLGTAAAIDEIVCGRGRLFDPDVVDACVAIFTDGFDFGEQSF